MLFKRISGKIKRPSVKLNRYPLEYSINYDLCLFKVLRSSSKDYKDFNAGDKDSVLSVFKYEKGADEDKHLKTTSVNRARLSYDGLVKVDIISHGLYQ